MRARAAWAAILLLLLTGLIHKAAAKGVWFENNLIEWDVPNGGIKPCFMAGLIGGFFRDNICESSLAMATTRKGIINTANQFENKSFGAGPCFCKFGGCYIGTPNALSADKFGGLFIGEKEKTGQNIPSGIFGGQLALSFFFINRSDCGRFSHNGCTNPSFGILRRGFSHVFEILTKSNFGVSSFGESEFYELRRCFDPRALIGLHHVQLSLHDGQLPVKGDILQATYYQNGDREERYPNRSSSRSSGRTILGIFLFLCGAAVMKISFNLLDVPYNPVRLRWGARGLWAGAAILVCQGTVLILTGNWLP
jgi:hypothetical protein